MTESQSQIRVAAAQFHVGNDVDANLNTCLRMLDKASGKSPNLIVLPEFSNHCSWYNDAAHCYEVSVELDGPFLSAIADRARRISAYVVINCTVRQDNERATGTSVLISPDGETLGVNHKQVLIGHENDFLDRATEAGPVIETPLGRLAMYSCMDGVINETPRCLALRGAQVLCNSLNSFAIDEGNLHIPVRAAENKVWVVAANKVGPLIPAELVGPVSEATSIPRHFLDGAGDSQIVAPDGTVVAIAGRDEDIVFADIDPRRADDKSRPDGSDLYGSRRPELYAPLGQDPAGQVLNITGPENLVAAAVDTLDDIPAAESEGARLICVATPARADDVQEKMSDGTLVATPGQANTVRLMSKQGVLLTQHTLHTEAGAGRVETADTKFGRLAVLSAQDAVYPETFRLAALQSVGTVLVAGSPLEDWEGRTGFVERAAENRVNVILASTGAGERGSLIAAIQKDFTIMTEWRERPFDGLLSCPVIHRREAGATVLVAEIHPQAAANKECSRNTHLLASRPWQLLQPILDSN